MKKEYTDNEAMEFTVGEFSKIFNSTFGDPRYGIVLSEGSDAGSYIPWRNAYAAAKKGDEAICDAVERFSCTLPDDYS